MQLEIENKENGKLELFTGSLKGQLGTSPHSYIIRNVNHQLFLKAITLDAASTAHSDSVDPFIKSQ